MTTDHRKLSNHQEAIKCYKKALELTSTPMECLLISNNLGATYMDNKDYQKAVEVFEQLKLDPILVTNNILYDRVLDNWIYLQWLQKPWIAVETELHRILDSRIERNDKRGQVTSYTHLGEYYAKTKQREATVCFDSVIRLARQLEMPTAEKDAVRYLVELRPRDLALKERCIFLQDTMYRQELKVKTQFAKYKYDDKSKQEFILRLEKEKIQNDLEVIHQRNQKTIFLFSVVILIIVLAYVFCFFTQRAKHLKQLNKVASLEAIYKTEAELSRRLYDDFGAKINHAMTLVQNNAALPIVLNTLEEIYHQSRDFSREINEVDTGSSYRDGLLEMLQLYTPISSKLYMVGSQEIDWMTVPVLGKTVLYKVLRELIINMAKYSQATLVTLTFKTIGNVLHVTYADNGVGASKEEMRNKNGLQNMEKRIYALLGTVQVETAKGKGFKVDINIPL